MVRNYKPKKKMTSAEAKSACLSLLAEGYPIKTAMETLELSAATYYNWCKSDESFKANADRTILQVKNKVNIVPTKPVPDFATFCEEYLDNKMFAHHLQWADMIEGKEPRNLHPSMDYHKGRPNRIIINTPPHHAKSTVITVNWVIYNIVKNPDVRIAIVSRKAERAADFLEQIKDRLTSPPYQKLQDDFGPPGGWKEGASQWKQDRIFVGNRTPGKSKDPTVQAIGINGSIYGARLDILIIDDGVDDSNAKDYAHQMTWLSTIANSRLERGGVGKVVIVGTRLAVKDLYGELKNAENYPSMDESPWTSLVQPAVLEYADDPKDWVTLWPKTTLPPNDSDAEPDEDGLYTMWDGYALKDLRETMHPNDWARFYQQAQVSNESTFTLEMINPCIDGGRLPGLIPANKISGRENGMEGLVMMGGIDPAAQGYTAMTVLGLDLQKEELWIVDLVNERDMSIEAMKNTIKALTVKYNIVEWVYEGNGFQRSLTQDKGLLTFLSMRGTRMLNHITTGANKYDPSFGIMSLTGLFELQNIHLPSTRNANVTKLVEQLITWKPNQRSGEGKMATDIVMSMWIVIRRAQEMMQARHNTTQFRTNKFTRSGITKRRYVHHTTNSSLAMSS